jgi:hypothetical protein
LTKVFNWIIALCGLWEFADIAALFVPDFGAIQAFVWSHILTGLFLMLAGAWAALTSSTRTARRIDWAAAAAGLWLMAAPFVLRADVLPAGVWNDVIVGGIVVILAMWAARASRRKAG